VRKWGVFGVENSGAILKKIGVFSVFFLILGGKSLFFRLKMGVGVFIWRIWARGERKKR
jgi:hypothetical protein